MPSQCLGGSWRAGSRGGGGVGGRWRDSCYRWQRRRSSGSCDGAMTPQHPPRHSHHPAHAKGRHGRHREQVLRGKHLHTALPSAPTDRDRAPGSGQWDSPAHRPHCNRRYLRAPGRGWHNVRRHRNHSQFRRCVTRYKPPASPYTLLDVKRSLHWHFRPQRCNVSYEGPVPHTEHAHAVICVVRHYNACTVRREAQTGEGSCSCPSASPGAPKPPTSTRTAVQQAPPPSNSRTTWSPLRAFFHALTATR
jgi:hypothetical protein